MKHIQVRNIDCKLAHNNGIMCDNLRLKNQIQIQIVKTQVSNGSLKKRNNNKKTNICEINKIHF